MTEHEQRMAAQALASGQGFVVAESCVQRMVYRDGHEECTYRYHVYLTDGLRLPSTYSTREEAEQAGRRASGRLATPSPVQVGARVTRRTDTRVAGTVVNVYGRKARVCWDRALRGGSRIGGGVTQHSTVLVSSLLPSASGEAK